LLRKNNFMGKIKLENIKEKDLFYFGERIEPRLVTSFTIDGMQNVEKSVELFGIKSIVRWLQVNDYFYQFEADLKNIDKEITKKLEHTRGDYVDRLIGGCSKAGKTLQTESIHYGRLAKKIKSRSELAKAILGYERAMLDYCVYYQTTHFERSVKQLAEVVVKKYASGENGRELLNLITAADKLTGAEHEKDDFYKLALVPKNKKEKLAARHAKKYGWLAIRYFLGNPWTKQDILGRLKKMNLEQAKKELDKSLLHRNEREKLISQAIKNFGSKDKKIIKQIRGLVYLRTKRGEFFHESSYQVRPLLKKIASVLKIKYEDVLHLTASEMVSALREEINYLKIIRERQQGFLIFHDYVRRNILAGDEVKKYLKTHVFLRVKTENITEFSGQIGYKGKVKGKVKILKNYTDIKKVQGRDIIVTTMTTANFLPALEKASAFITDEGGITCHAAIVAREMKKPCIIGTKIATEVLHDCDLVEVDADKGVVKILK